MRGTVKIYDFTSNEAEIKVMVLTSSRAYIFNCATNEKQTIFVLNTKSKKVYVCVFNYIVIYVRNTTRAQLRLTICIGDSYAGHFLYYRNLPMRYKYWILPQTLKHSDITGMISK